MAYVRYVEDLPGAGKRGDDGLGVVSDRRSIFRGPHTFFG